MFLEALGYTWHDTCFVCSVSKLHCPGQSLVLDTPGSGEYWGQLSGEGREELCYGVPGVGRNI